MVHLDLVVLDQIELALYHMDLPKAAEAEYVRDDPHNGVIELTSPPPEFDAIIAIAKVIERPARNP